MFKLWCHWGINHDVESCKSWNLVLLLCFILLFLIFVTTAKRFFLRCSLCRSVSDSYDSMNASYGMNGQVLFVRVNVDEFKVGDALKWLCCFNSFCRELYCAVTSENINAAKPVIPDSNLSKAMRGSMLAY